MTFEKYLVSTVEEMFRGIDIHSFILSDPTNFIGETLRIREAVGLPNRFVVIA